MVRAHWSDALVRLCACDDAVEWASEQPSAEVAWQACQRGDWLLWIARRVASHGDAEHRAVVRAACACARTTLHRVQAGDGLPRRAIETADMWTRGAVSLVNARAAADAAADVVEESRVR